MTSISDEDAAIMAEFVKTRERRLFEMLFQRYKRPILAHTHRFVRQRSRAEELTQDVFLRVYTTKNYQAQTRFKTWLYRVATNVCLNELRKQEHQQRLESLSDHSDGAQISAAPDLQNPDAALGGKQLAARLEARLGALPTKQRAAFLMARQDGLSHQEIASALETSVSAVKSLIHRALEALRQEYTSAISPEIKEARS